jgi:Acetyltransferase (GNAT) domain
MNNNKVDYIKLCESEPNIPIFIQNGWLDAVCTEGGLSWDVAVSRDKNSKIVAALVYVLRKKWGIDIITVPHLTKFTGIWQAPLPHSMHYENNNEEHNRIKDIISQLPHFHRLTLNLNTNLSDWSPFYWAGFSQTTRYVQVLESGENKETLHKNLNRNTKRNIKKAEEHFTVEVRDDFKDFIKLNNTVFERQQKENVTPLSIWQNLDAFLLEKQQRRIYFSMDKNGVSHGTFYMVWDNQYAYALANGLTETGRTYGAMSQLTWQAIQDAADMGLPFNFLGSMMPSVEVFNRGFNTVKKPYFVLNKSKNRVFEGIFNLLGK